jgi:hypothetical protein
MRPTFVLLVGTVVLLGATGAVAADVGQDGTPPWPNNETTTEDNSTDVSPGQQLAGAVGAQGASVEGEIWNRTLSERLANATTDEERAEVVTDEVELLETSIEVLEGVRANLTESWADGEMSEGEYRASLSEFVVRAHTVERRANQTVRAAEDLPARVRDDHDINVSHIEDLSERASELYEFEGEIGQEIANETIESAESEGPGERRRSDSDD